MKLELEYHDEAWSHFQNDNFTKMFEMVANIKNWSSSKFNATLNQHFKNDEKYIPCIINTSTRCIIGLDVTQYINIRKSINNKCLTIWCNLPNIDYLTIESNGILACNGGLIVVEGTIQNSENNL